MKSLPPVELLEKSHQLPGPYMFKVIGRVELGFVARVVAAVREELAYAQDPPFKCRHTTGGRHVSITLEPRVESGSQILAVYSRLQKLTGLVMVL